MAYLKQLARYKKKKLLHLFLVARTRVIKMSLIQQIILTEFGGQCFEVWSIHLGRPNYKNLQVLPSQEAGETLSYRIAW